LERLDGADMDITPLWLGGNAPRALASSLSLDDPDLFAEQDVVVAYTQGDLGFNAEVKRRFLEFIRNGGGYVAIHSAADSFPGWDEYTTMLGGRFESHPPVGEISVQIDVSDHDITRGLPTNWTLVDEFYHLKNYRDDDKLVLMRGRSPGDAEDAPLRPVAWEKNYGHGRVFYTILGHGHETFDDERFQRLITNAVKWAADAPKPDENGVYHLFDGKTKYGWSMAGPGEFLIEDGALLATGGMGMLWYHERRFRDFTLTLEWKTEKITDNSGVFVRFAKPSNDPWYAVRHGHEIQILDDPNAGETRGTGSIYAHADARQGASNPPGEWNLFEITLRGDEYTVVLNGTQICQWSSPTDRHGREGYIGLQNHSHPVRFRNITVKELD
jgi:type 1 glutamine amidotransferase